MMKRPPASFDRRRRSGRPLVLTLAGVLAMAGCRATAPDAAVRPMEQLPLALQAYLSIDTYFIAQGMVSGRLASGHLKQDQARDLVATTLYARHLAAENVLHPTEGGERRVQVAIQMMLACVGQADSGSTAACLPAPVSAPDARRAEVASRPVEAGAAPR
ncbi:hypothetical protein Gdia_3515 [Gluconacetobacter diazotrophicus PA1 5]|uniref:Uncharacterized protein n=1 Tax=Gluconacetobacter diazotrophicus TaxID=33996 RepID=A0A7W4FE21_GLUDI|nr:hypothetical protein [Gluconacetobacter diazotrophicus]ACI53239.1 hypothetical protein Gdia_3515 [Gluconacetobacter diazotrophicus PA1 5]MBB2156009.1 hypothetical protein [Gluconacetobacter diazotrophicus]TWB10386.1 hypothetical protein FBZ86_102127 [Gluconacetobacter diazotrophicus]